MCHIVVDSGLKMIGPTGTTEEVIGGTWGSSVLLLKDGHTSVFFFVFLDEVPGAAAMHRMENHSWATERKGWTCWGPFVLQKVEGLFQWQRNTCYLLFLFLIYTLLGSNKHTMSSSVILFEAAVLSFPSTLTQLELVFKVVVFGFKCSLLPFRFHFCLALSCHILSLCSCVASNVRSCHLDLSKCFTNPHSPIHSPTAGAPEREPPKHSEEATSGAILASASSSATVDWATAALNYAFPWMEDWNLFFSDRNMSPLVPILEPGGLVLTTKIISSPRIPALE